MEKLKALVGIGENVVNSWVVETLFIMAAATAAHWVLRALLNNLQRRAEGTRNEWDNVVLLAATKPLLSGWLGLALWFLLDVTRHHYQIQLLNYLESLAVSGLIVLIGWFLLRLIKQSELHVAAEREGLSGSSDTATVLAVGKLLRITVWVIMTLILLQNLGISVSGLLAFGGIGGIAVGFAAKDLLANFFGSLTIFLDRPFTVGDWIRSPDQEIEGTVEDIGWRLTRIRTFDQRPLYVPNSVFTQISVENPSRMLNRRIYETVGLRYEDADKVDAIIVAVRDMLEQHVEIDPNRTLIVNFNGFGPSSLDFFIYTFTKTTDWVRFHEIKQDVLLQVLSVIHAQGADVAFPTQTVHLLGPESGEAIVDV
jgi:MscS family membrane protein